MRRDLPLQAVHTYLTVIMYEVAAKFNTRRGALFQPLLSTNSLRPQHGHGSLPSVLGLPVTRDLEKKCCGDQKMTLYGRIANCSASVS